MKRVFNDLKSGDVIYYEHNYQIYPDVVKNIESDPSKLTIHTVQKYTIEPHDGNSNICIGNKNTSIRLYYTNNEVAEETAKTNAMYELEDCLEKIYTSLDTVKRICKVFNIDITTKINLTI